MFGLFSFRAIRHAVASVFDTHTARVSSLTGNLSCAGINKSLVLTATLMAVFLCPRAANAVAVLSIDPAPVTWNVIGLDSNNVNVGPQDYPVGVRVRNTGTMDATNVTATFSWLTNNTNINLLDDDQVTTTVIPAGGYADFYYTVRVTRTAAAYDTTRDYQITITGGGLVTPLTTSDRLYVQKLVSQQANDVLSLVGPSEIEAGQIRTFILTSKTQTNKDQLENFVNFPNDIFQVIDIDISFTSPGATSDKFYLDACGWIRTIPPGNMSCNGPDMYGGSVGGDIVTIYTVYVIQTPPQEIVLSALILDKGGNAYHYNSDFGDNILPVRPPADLFVVKSAVDDPVEAGNNAVYLLTVVNADPNTQAKDVVLSDTLPAGLTFIASNPPPTSGPNPLIWNIGNLDGGSSYSVNLIARTSCNTTGPVTNRAFVSSTTGDSMPGNNSTSQTITVRDTTPPMITCPANIIVNADAGMCQKSNVTYSATATDNCTTVSVSLMPASGSTFAVGVHTVTATATDASGNTAQCQFTVTVLDVQPPTITCGGTITAAADSGTCSKANLVVPPPMVSDNCTTTPVTISGTRSDMLPLTDPYPVGSTTITWKATDATGLMATCNQIVTINDTTPPMITCPSNITVGSTPGQCGAANVGFNVTATDNCGAVTVVTVPPAGSMFPVGTTTVNATATDSAGNMATCSFTVTVTDSENPTITCPPPVSVSSSAMNCSAPNVTIGTPTTGDNCGVASTVGVRSDMLPLTDPYPVGTTTITWTVTDTSNRTASCMQTVTVTDDTNPMITCPPTIDVVADPLTCSAANVTTTDPLTSDNCSTVSLVGVRSDGQALSAPYPVGTTTITWTVTDASNNTASCMQLVIVRDVTPPSITCPPTLNVESDSDACEASDVTITPPMASGDNCTTTPVVITGTRDDMLALSDPYPVGTTIITWKATDAAGNMTTCPQQVIVSDDTPPTITCPATVNVTVGAMGCTASGVNLGTPMIADNCLNPMVAGERSDMLPLTDPYPLGTTTITWTVTDAAGNMATCQQLVNVTDDTDPTITCPPDVTVNSDPATCSAGNVTLGMPTTGDNCTVASVVGTRSDMLPLNSPFPVGTTIVTWTVTDGSGNTTSCMQDVTVNDTTPPMITCPPTIDVVADNDLCAAAEVTVTTPTITSDNCSTASIMGVRSDMLALDAPYPVGITTITWTVTDTAGNSAMCEQLVVIRDTTPPGIICPPTVNVNADAMGCSAEDVVIAPPTTTDNCTTQPLVAVGVRSDMMQLDDPYPVGMTTITWTVTDAAGNTATCMQQVNVSDVTDPTITCGPTVNVAASAMNCTAADVVVTAPLTSDNCSTSTLVGTRSDMLALTAPYPLGTTTITWTVTDASGNMASCMQDVVVTDVTAPTVTCPQTITLGNTPGMCGAVVTFSVTATDACGNTSVTVVATPPSGSFFPVGTTTVNVTATDEAGNQSTCSFNVVINDIQNPTITCPPPIMTCMQDVVLSSPLTADNCATSTLVAMRSDGLALDADYPVGTTNVTWTVTDSSGNMASCNQVVMVSSDVLPHVICPEDIVVSATEQCVSLPVEYPEPMVMDNCSTDTTNLTIVYDPPEGSILPIGETIVTITVTDTMNNSDSCTFKVTVVDVTAPTVTCPSDITVNNTTGQCGAASVSFEIGATDSCSLPVTVIANPPSGSPFPVGTTVVNVTATDAAGNSAMCSFNVTVNDTQNPFITCPPTVDVMADADMCLAASVDLGQPMTGDNCGTETLTAVRGDGQPLSAPYPVGTTTVTWTVTDAAGNSASCNQLVTVRDTMMPSITCPPDITVNAVMGTCLSGPVEYGAAMVSDNCSTGSEGLTVTFVPPSGSTFPVGMSTVTATVTDSSGNQASCTFKVTVNDVTPPQLSCPANIVVNNTPDQCGAASVTFTPVATDSCSLPVTVVATPPSGSMFPVGTTTVNVTATDAAGNSAMCSFTVIVNDTQLPTITCPPTVDVMADPDQCQAAEVNLGLPVTADNCSTASVTAVRSDMLPLSAPYPVGTTIVTWTVTDDAGNIATCTQQVIVRDTMMPSITCPANIVVSAVEGQCVSGPVQYGPATVSDNCTPMNQLTVVYTPPSGSTFPIGTWPVIATVTDMSGNQATCTFTVTVNDVTPPQLTCPANITVNNSPGQCGAAQVGFEILATDSCSAPVTIVATPPSGSTFPVGTTTVNVTATDGAGNSAMCSFTVTVNDTQVPTITCPPTVDVMADADQCQAAEVDLGLPVTADNCSTASVTAVRSDMQPLSAPYPVGTTTVTWTVTDNAGNMATCTQQVIVRDSMMPTISCPGDITVSALVDQCMSEPVQYPNPTISDNCTPVENLTVVFDPPQGTSFPLGTNLVTVTVTDMAGNTAICTFNVIVNDTTPPVVTCPSNITVNSTAGECGAANVTFMTQATDNCSSFINVVNDPPSGSTFPVGTTVVTSTATDMAGNSASCSFTVTVLDVEDPTLVCPAPIVVVATTNDCMAANVTYSAEVSDNCNGPVTVTFNPPSGSSFPIGVHMVQVTATDAAGNIATCSFTVTVEDREAPRIACPPDITVEAIECELDAVVNLVPPEVADNCDTTVTPSEATSTNGTRALVSIEGVRSDGRPLTDRFPIGQTTIVWTASDASGNQSSCTQLVNVEAGQCVPVCDGPDLVIMTKMAPSYKCNGKVVKCKVEGWYIVTNIGTQTSGETSVCFYLSEDEVLDAGDYQCKPNKKKHKVKSLRPGEMVGIDLKCKAPKGVNVADWYVIAVVDCPNVVEECREDNNTIAEHPMPKMK